MESMNQDSGGKLCTHIGYVFTLLCVDLGFISQWTEDSCSNTCRVSGTSTRGRSLVEKYEGMLHGFVLPQRDLAMTNPF